jgi:hypothetical protein
MFVLPTPTQNMHIHAPAPKKEIPKTEDIVHAAGQASRNAKNPWLQSWNHGVSMKNLPMEVILEAFPPAPSASTLSAEFHRRSVSNNAGYSPQNRRQVGCV